MIPRKPVKSSRTRRAARPSGSTARKTARTAGPAKLQRMLKKYIDVILDVGLNLQPGQRLLIVNNLLQGVDVSLAPFVRMLAEAAYRRGSPFRGRDLGRPAA